MVSVVYVNPMGEAKTVRVPGTVSAELRLLCVGTDAAARHIGTIYLREWETAHA